MPAFGCTSVADEEAMVHQKLSELATLDPEILTALHLIVHDLLETAQVREEWLRADPARRRIMTPVVLVEPSGRTSR